ncbi:MAG TPA: PrsW family intramembrane metalloprotease [Saprospiraceae bacterium]|nr:PrsW family intramembrane metalloprotease [Saprospiraceae bacterium]
MTILLYILAVLPGLVISYFIYRADLYEKESKPLLLVCFALGALVTYPAILMEGYAETLGWGNSRNFFKVFFFALLFVGLLEEFFKMVCLILPYFRKEFNEPFDGIVYAVMIAMGFATLENIIYANYYGIQTALLRIFTAVPAHGAFAVMVGYYVGLSKEAKKEKPWILILRGLGLTSFLHGLYDFFIIQPYAEWLMSLATLVLIFCLYLSYKMIKALQTASPFHPDKIKKENN